MSDTTAAKPRITTREMVALAVLTALTFAVQVIMSPLPNIELVSLLIALATRRFRFKALFVVYGFALLEISMYGLGLWSVNYLYVWTVLWGACMLLGGMRGAFGWALLLFAFGLCFGALCSIVYLFIGGPRMMLGYFVSGIPFDLIHAAGNGVLGLVLFGPLDRLMARVTSNI